MKLIHWLKEEAKEMAVLFVYFAFYFNVFIVFKKLILAHYHISFYGFGAALVGALIAAKAVLVVESSPLSRPLRNAAPYLKILYDTLLYTLLSLVFLYLERIVELAHKQGTWQDVFQNIGQEEDWYQFAAIVGWAGLCFLGYSFFAAMNRHTGTGELVRLLFTPHREKADVAPKSAA
jgi:hypothetical protein